MLHTVSGVDLLDELRSARRGAPALSPLEPDTYARGHAAFEARSDQRRLITDYLTARMELRCEGSVSVLSVGCGDGSVDAPLAAVLTDVEAGSERPVHYVGVDPFVGSTRAFTAAMARLGRPSLSTEVHAATFDQANLRPATFDVVTFVHSMYYVTDVAATLRAAHDLLRPGGELLVLSAPCGDMNALVEVLAPPVEGHRQWFSADVATGLQDAGLLAEEVLTLDARLDLQDADDDVVEFTVQARLSPALQTMVRDYLDAVSVPGPGGTGLRVPHPVDVYRVTRPA